MAKQKGKAVTAAVAAVAYGGVALANNGAVAFWDPTCGFEYPDCSKSSDVIAFASGVSLIQTELGKAVVDRPKN